MEHRDDMHYFSSSSRPIHCGGKQGWALSSFILSVFNPSFLAIHFSPFSGHLLSIFVNIGQQMISLSTGNTLTILLHFPSLFLPVLLSCYYQNCTVCCWFVCKIRLQFCSCYFLEIKFGVTFLIVDGIHCLMSFVCNLFFDVRLVCLSPPSCVITRYYHFYSQSGRFLFFYGIQLVHNSVRSIQGLVSIG